MNPAPGMLKDLVEDLEGCVIQDFYNQILVDNPGAWDVHSNDSHMLRTGSIPPVTSPPGFTTALSSTHGFTEHRFLNDIISSMVNARLSFYVEAYLVYLHAVHGQQLTVGQAISILRSHPSSVNPGSSHFGHTASPPMPFVPPVGISTVPPGPTMTDPGTSAGIPTQVLTEVEAENALAAGDLSSLRRIFSNGDRLRVECLWPNCGRKMMKDNHPRHLRECHQRAKRGVARKNNTFHNPVG